VLLLQPELADEAFEVVKKFPPERDRAIIFAYALGPDHLIISCFKAGFGHANLADVLRSKGHGTDDVHSSTIMWRAGQESHIATDNAGVLNPLPKRVRERLMLEISKRL